MIQVIFVLKHAKLFVDSCLVIGGYLWISRPSLPNRNYSLLNWLTLLLIGFIARDAVDLNTQGGFLALMLDALL